MSSRRKQSLTFWSFLLGRPLGPTEQLAKRAIDRESRPLRRVNATDLLGIPAAWAVNEILLHQSVGLRTRIVVSLAAWLAAGYALHKLADRVLRRRRG